VTLNQDSSTIMVVEYSNNRGHHSKSVVPPQTPQAVLRQSSSSISPQSNAVMQCKQHSSARGQSTRSGTREM
jgi:hypothetical protein